VKSIGLPPAGKFHIDVDPSALAFKKWSIRGTIVSSLADVDETLEFARRGLLKLEPTVVGLSKFNESCQKLKNGEVAGYVNPESRIWKS
jgi:propanol-preferring alcohol dehydrogenase